ncbi:MAG: hypothetical protein JRJ56_01875 [Deltaproteobacteria bacterium]|nr:hypothetical protein [Deltaproteobacteria bacterium]
MKKLAMVAAVLVALAMVLPAQAADLKVKGDFNNRFMVYTNHNDWLQSEKGGLEDGTVNETWGEAKYRMWVEASTNDGKVKGVWATEVGALHYGDESKGAGGYSGDGIVFENRWMYTDFQMPWCDNSARVRMGLQPFTANSWLWQETVMGVKFYGAAGSVNYELAWLRPWETQVYDKDDDARDLDSIYARLNFKPADGLKAGLFAVYMTGDSDKPASQTGTITSQHYEVKKFANKYDLSLFTIGTDGKWNSDSFFVNWDLMYQTGSVDNANFQNAYKFGNGVAPDHTGPVVTDDFDVSAYFLHADIGMKMDAWKFTYTFWYASGDDDDTDGDFDAYLAIDVDRADSICLFEGGYTDDNYFTEKPYLLDKGFIMNKLSADYKANKKLTMGAAVMYMMTAEDIEYRDLDGEKQKDDSIGVEVDAYLKYKIYDNLEFAINAGYLFADDAMDYFEADRDGNSDEDIFLSTARVRYKF